MVNETNKPQQDLENRELGQRLEASNQALADMQAEHRQLLAEMEQLRKRAEDLQRLRDLQKQEEEEKKSTDILESRVDRDSNEEQKEENNEECDPEEADYIKEKLAEIARLKEQFKRVQHMISTTELIENHISKNEAAETQLQKEKSNPNDKSENILKPQITTDVPIVAATLAATDPELITMPNMPTMADLNAASTPDEKEQLILTMLNMFQNFSSDLKSQADNLRAERDRLRELKESIIRSRKDQHK